MAGHRAGTDNIRRIIERFADYGVQCLTLYAFSTENWARPKAEVNGLMRILSRVIKRETNNFHREGIRLQHLGRLEGLSPKLQREVLDAVELTKDNRRILSASPSTTVAGRDPTPSAAPANASIRRG
jgi:undecaprenyl diphosphate synthase